TLAGLHLGKAQLSRAYADVSGVVKISERLTLLAVDFFVMTSANAIVEHDVDAPTPLSELLRSATADQHQRAETRPFIADLMGGALTLGDYVDYVAQFAYVYEALESRDTSADPAPLHDPRLARLASIE